MLTLCSLFVAQLINAQINTQILYDFGEDRNHITITQELFKADKWGNTFAFIDVDFNNEFTSPSGAYMEIARCLNFWQDSKMGFLSLQVEYNGGIGTANKLNIIYPINSAFLAGFDIFFHSKDYRYTFNVKLLYKYFVGINSRVPMQGTLVWNMKDIFSLKGLSFSGFCDVWSESKMVILSEPQIWYNVGSLFNCEPLSIGGEVELAYNFAGIDGFMARPCIGLKWDF